MRVFETMLLIGMVVPGLCDSGIISIIKKPLSCHKTSAQIVQTFMEEDTQKKIGIKWSSTNSVIDFSMSKWVDVTGAVENKYITNFKIDKPFAADTQIMACVVSYKTRINLPTIITTILGIKSEFKITKHIFIRGKIIHIIAEVENIPLVHTAEIYTKITVYDNAQILSKNLVKHGEIPSYVIWAQASIENEMKESLTRNTDIVASTVCES